QLLSLSQFVAFATLLAAANAGLIPAPLSYAPAAHLTYAAASPVVAAPLAKAVAVAPAKYAPVDADYDPHPQYSYAYDVHDSLTGDAKSQQETRDGDIVQGSYSLIEADGTRRIVDYTADSVNGFNAVVRKEAASAPLIAEPVAKIATPIAKIAYAAPVAKLAYAAPVAKIAAAPAFSYATKLAAPLAYAPAPAAYIH
ncbi:larval cuticle protein A3A-like, partial [Calliopsis andreniformis]|uniref:larval cuticle protein A3A-like n=1 Tax=Calliopsis andreniformis TaxID=337506 RepID=UPI003FCCD562